MSKIFLRIFVFIGLIFTFQLFADGLTGKYYDNNNFTNLKLTRVDATIDFDWGGGSPDASMGNDHFSVEWTGFIYIPEDAKYRFYLAHDDVMVLNIDGVELYNNSNWTGGSNSYNNTGWITLTTGYHPITIRFTEWGGGAYAKFAWRNNKSISSQIIVPTTNLFTTEPSSPSDFPLRYKANLMGNMKIIGNTVLCPKNTFGQCVESGKTGSSISNAQEDLRYVDIDSDGMTFNSSSATLQDSAIKPDSDNPQPARIVWAGLYWSGYLHTNDEADRTTKINSNTNATIYNSQYTSLTSMNDIDTLISNHTVKLTIDGTTYDISGELLGTNEYYKSTNYNGKSYAKFADITSLLKDKDPVTTYRVANIPAMEGVTNNYDYFWYGNGVRAIINSVGNSFNASYYNGASANTLQDGLGNSGAWTIVVIYENNSEGEKTRNASVFDGFVALGETTEITIPIEGFLTPSSGTVDSTLSVFANEGDRYIYNDYIQLSDKGGAYHYLGDSGNYFNSSIKGVDTRNPTIINNQGIDIHTENVGDANGGEDIISNNQTSTNIKIGTDGDYYYPIMVAFATELYKPELCYDFAGYIGNNIPVSIDTNRTFSVSKWGDDDPFYIKAFIRSEEADFDLVNTGLKVILNDINGSSLSSKLPFDLTQTKVSPNSFNGYEAAIGITGESDMFSIGENNSVLGGTIAPNENTYAKAAFIFNTANIINGKFDLEIHTYLQLDPDNPTDLTPYIYSTTDPESLPMCERNYVYDPIWYWFNVEPGETSSNANAVDRYSLLTQIVGRSFDIDVASYSGDEYDVETTLTETTTVDLELINAGGFENNSSVGYDSVCSDADNNMTEGQFVTLNANQSRVTVPNFTSDTALENAAFRLWVLTITDEDGNDNIIPHSCDDADDEDCFKDVYETYYVDANLTACESECENESGCYECLKENYATPVCSRDNFAIRPKGFRVSIKDDNENNGSVTPKDIVSNDGGNDDNNASLAAGYKYMLDLKTLAYDDTAIALGYYNENFKAASLSTLTNEENIVALEFVDSSAKCNDTNSTTYNYVMQNGVLTSDHNGTEEFSFDNVGDYDFWVDDTNWTRVDQYDYIYKTEFNGNKKWDCVENSATAPLKEEVGCDTRSIIDSDTGYNNVDLHFNPYGFDLSSVNMTNSPNNANTSWLFTNNLSEDSRMGARFYGNVIAIAKGGTQTSNFVDGCAATDVNLDLNITSTPEEGNITALDKDGYSTSIGLNNIIIGVDSNVTSANGTQSTIPKEYFAKDSNGSSTIDLRYNYDRFNAMVTNPIMATFHALTASAPDANASAEMDDNRTPDGTQNYDTNITFLKGRVYTELETFNDSGGYDLEDDNINIIFTALAYCEDTVDINCTDTMRTLNSDSTLTGEITNWYPMTSHIDTYDENSINDGKILQISDENGVGVNISTVTNIEFDNGAKTSNINIEEGTATEDATIRVSPDFWLKYHEDSSKAGNPYFILNFNILSDEWTGVGNTGHKIDINASKGSMDRTTW